MTFEVVLSLVAEEAAAAVAEATGVLDEEGNTSGKK